jgi:hypothetical protein
MKAHHRRGFGLLAAAAVLAAVATPARADVVTDWNQHATDALVVTGAQTPPVSAIHMAMVHGAVYDAVNAIDRRHQPYLTKLRARRWYSQDAAAATAAYRMLLAIVPAQQPTLEAKYLASLALVPPGRAKDGGIAVGEAAAAAMLAARANDGRFGSFRFTVDSAPGEWRPVLPAFVNDPNAWIARVTPFLLRNAAQVRTNGPRELTTGKYARELDEVETLGSATSSARTADQTDMSRFWAEHAIAMWSRIFRQLSADERLRTADSARYFAMLYLTAADAAIGCWDDKARWSFWRPITAIREADTDGNPATDADPAWLPLIATPPYPDHPSGHNCISGSIVATLQDFFGTDRAEFSAVSAVSGTKRSFTRFSQAIDEIIDARVYSGLHFRTADVQGARLGREVARWREHHYFRPARRH